MSSLWRRWIFRNGSVSWMMWVTVTWGHDADGNPWNPAYLYALTWLQSSIIFACYRYKNNKNAKNKKEGRGRKQVLLRLKPGSKIWMFMSIIFEDIQFFYCNSTANKLLIGLEKTAYFCNSSNISINRSSNFGFRFLLSF